MREWQDLAQIGREKRDGEVVLLLPARAGEAESGAIGDVWCEVNWKHHRTIRLYELLDRAHSEIYNFGMNPEEWKPDFRETAERVVRRVMEGNTSEEIEEAICNYEEYSKVCWEIAERLEREGKEVLLDEH